MFYHLKTKHCISTVRMLDSHMLVTKEHIVTYLHLKFKLKPALNFNKLLIKLFHSEF